MLARHPSGYDGFLSDVWSCGVVLYVFLSASLPFDEPRMEALLERIANADYRTPGYMSDGARALLGRMLVAQPLWRASLAEVLSDGWLARHPGEVSEEEDEAAADLSSLASPLSCPIDLADAVSQLPRARLRDLHTAFGDSRVALT